MNRLLDLLLPRFITEDVALIDSGDGLAIVCRVADTRPGETYPAVATIRSFNLFGFALFPKMIGEAREWPSDTHPGGIPFDEDETASQQLLLPPCPFCEGPPVVVVTHEDRLGSLVDRHGSYGGCAGLDVSARVACHECGAAGPEHFDVIYCSATYEEAEREAALLWIERTAKHRPLYDAGLPEGLNHYPRSAQA